MNCLLGNPPEMSILIFIKNKIDKKLRIQSSVVLRGTICVKKNKNRRLVKEVFSDNSGMSLHEKHM